MAWLSFAPADAVPAWRLEIFLLVLVGLYIIFTLIFFWFFFLLRREVSSGQSRRRRAFTVPRCSFGLVPW